MVMNNNSCKGIFIESVIKCLYSTALTLFYLSYLNETEQQKKSRNIGLLNCGLDLINNFP